jgi:hypothetical protein
MMTGLQYLLFPQSTGIAASRHQTGTFEEIEE